VSWVIWRQHRTQLLVTAIMLAIFSIAVVATGVHMADVYSAALARCRASSGCSVLGNLFQGYGAIVDTVHATILVPVALGAIGTTLVAREVETSTNALAWTQSVTRRRWVLSKVAAVLAGSVVVTAGVSALVTWWSSTPNALYGNRFQGAQFDTQNVAPIAFVIFAVGLGVATGSVLRRTLPAVFTTVALYVGVRLAVGVFLRPAYAPAHEVVQRLGVPDRGNSVPTGSWTLSEHIVDRAHHVVNGGISVPGGCRGVADVDACLGRFGYGQLVRFHPPSDYWRFQWTEFAIFAVLGLVLTGIGIVVALRRDA
jgi:hypothetical protein